MPNLSSVLAPLNRLLQKRVSWQWGNAESAAFREAKQLLTSSSLLVHFDQSLELLLACDASPYGIGAVLSHKFRDGSERPICYASRSLTAEKNYSQLEREGLAVIFGVKRFHQYLFGHTFTILSDHQPLKSLFGETRAIPVLASATIQRWALTLSAYNYKIAYKSGKTMCNADALSRLPLPEPSNVENEPAGVFLLREQLSHSLVTADHVRRWTDKDPILAKVKKFTVLGWPIDVSDSVLLPFYRRRLELSILDGCILLGSRIIMPPPGRETVLNELHGSHIGMARMKSLARSYVWWPNMDNDIERLVQRCVPCQSSRSLPATAPLQPWGWPERPWVRVHLDYAGPFLGKMFMVLIDAHSKWMEVQVVSSATARVTIEKLRAIFSTHGLPHQLVSDNASIFTCPEFSTFLEENGISHIRSSPYHPATNGLAERAVQTLKQGLKRLTQGSIEARLARFLFTYRLTPQSTTNSSPAELLLGRRPRSRFDSFFPSVGGRVDAKIRKQKVNHDQHSKMRVFQAEDTVLVRDFRPNNVKWLPGVIVCCLSQVSYRVRLDDGRIVRRHVDHVRSRVAPVSQLVDDDDEIFTSPSGSTHVGSHSADTPATIPLPPLSPASTSPPPTPALPRRSSRPRHPPSRFMQESFPSN